MDENLGKSTAYIEQQEQILRREEALIKQKEKEEFYAILDAQRKKKRN